MPLTFPSTLVPTAVSDPMPISPSSEYISDLTQSMQVNGSSTHLFQCEFEFPPLSVDEYRLLKSIAHKFNQDDVIIPYYEPWIKNTYTGGFNVAAGSSGFGLNIKNIGSGVSLAVGQAISVQTSGKWYFYTLAAASASGSTTRTLTLTSAIRRPHADGDAISINPAYIQGRGILTTPKGDNSGRYNGCRIIVREKK